MEPRTTRFSEQAIKEIETAARERGFGSPSGFIRYAIEQELSGREAGITGVEERLAATIEQVRREMFRLMRAQQALFAYVDTLAKTILTCMPEPPADAKPQAVAQAKERYNRLLKSAGRAMVGEAKLAMEDLVTNGEQ